MLAGKKKLNNNNKVHKKEEINSDAVPYKVIMLENIYKA